MKNLKLKVISSLMAGALLFPAVAVHAEGTANTTNGFGSGLLKQQQNLLTRDQRLQFKDSMTQKKDTIKQNHETNQALVKTISDKKANVKSIIKNIEQSKKQLTSDDLDKIKAQLQIIDADKAALEDVNGKIKADYAQFKTDVKANNYTDASTQLDNIISVQNTRTTALNKLSSDLDTLLNELQTAETNATTPATGAPATQTSPSTGA